VASPSCIDRPIPFSFEHSWEMTSADYVRLNTPEVRPSRRGFVWLAAMIVCGVAALFWRYTAALGVLALMIVVLVVSMPRLVRSATRRRFAESEYLQGPVAYGVSSRGSWLRGQNLGAESEWTGLSKWRELDGWLILFSSGMPPVYLPIAELRSADLYDDVTALARAHGAQLDAPSIPPSPQPGEAD
jgi:hypothetical protein